MLKLTNVASATVSAALASGGTSLSLTTGNGSLFPALGAGEFFYGTLIDSGNNMEIVKVTARSGDTLTIVRGQDGTTARAFNAGDKFELRLVAAVFSELVQRDGSVAMTAALNHGGFKSTNMADPTAAQDGATKNYVDTAATAKVSKSGDTMSGTLQVPSLTIASTANMLTLNDTDWGTRYLHHNGGLAGFLDSAGSWAIYENNSGSVWTKGYGWLHDYFFSTVSNCTSVNDNCNGNAGNCYPGAPNWVNCYGGGNIFSQRLELLDNGNNVGVRSVRYYFNCNCNCNCTCK
jgi:hypothetical protein